jgi:membrane fusion protein (multidrug efflux system)
MLVGDDNKPVSRVVETSQTVGTNWLVTGGLKPGDKVIVEGLGRIRPGKPIKPVPAGSKPLPGKPGAGGDRAHGNG